MARPRFHRAPPPTALELERLLDTLICCITRTLVRSGALVAQGYDDEEQLWLDLDPDGEDALTRLQGAAVRYRIAVGPIAGRKSLRLHTPAPVDQRRCPRDRVGHIAEGLGSQGRDELIPELAGIERDVISRERSPVLAVHRAVGHERDTQTVFVETATKQEVMGVEEIPACPAGEEGRELHRGQLVDVEDRQGGGHDT